MKIKQYAGVLVMTLAVTAQTAYAAVVMQIDITDLSNVAFIATDAKSEIDSDSYLYEDGITLKNILPDGSAVEAPMDGTLTASASIDVVEYVDLGVGETEPRDLCIYVDGNPEPEYQVFSTDKRAFDGRGVTDFSGISFETAVVCTTGDIVAGFEDDVSEPIGQWQIIKTTVNCPPTNLSAAAGDGEAVITFMAGADNGSPITNYQYSLDGGDYTALSPADYLSPITITELDNGTAYSIRLKAINGVGSSAASEPVSVTPIAVPAVPAAPTSLSAEAGDGEAVITFMAGADNGSPIINYQYSLNGGDYALVSAPASSSITITGLDNDTAYSIRLKAINGVGASAASDPVSVTPIAGPAVPAAPTNLSAAAGDGEAVITFMAGADNGLPITNYQYSFDDLFYIPLSPADASGPITITGLDNGTTYSIRLKAINGVGASDASEPVSVTPIAVPAAPTNLSAAAGNTEAVITFMAGADNGSPITNYQYSFDDVFYIPLSPADASGPITITGLDNGTAYSIRLKAINGEGASAASEPVSVTPIAATATTPPTPQITNIDYGDAEIYISVSVTNNGGSAITGYTATCTDGTTQYTGTSATTHITVSGLTNGVAYTCTVTSTNALGPSPPSAASPPVTPEEAIAAGLPIWLLYEASK